MDTEEIARLKAEANALFQEAESAQFAGYVALVQARAGEISNHLVSYKAAVEDARAVCVEIAGCELDGWEPHYIQRYLGLYMQKEGIRHEDSEETRINPNWERGTPSTLRRRRHKTPK